MVGVVELYAVNTVRAVHITRGPTETLTYSRTLRQTTFLSVQTNVERVTHRVPPSDAVVIGPDILLDPPICVGDDREAQDCASLYVAEWSRGDWEQLHLPPALRSPRLCGRLKPSSTNNPLPILSIHIRECGGLQPRFLHLKAICWGSFASVGGSYWVVGL